MNEQLLLSNIRSVLIRLEETIIFALTERAQFASNPSIYRAGAFGDGTQGESLVGHLLRGTEGIHAQIRRYTSPDECSFFDDLPEPILPPLPYTESPLRPNNVNLNHRIRSDYESSIVPFICRPGRDGQFGSSSVCDVTCLQALSKRIHYGKFVAESKFRLDEDRFRRLVAAEDRDGLMDAITDQAVQDRVLVRVKLKAKAHGQDVEGDPTQRKIDPERVAQVYHRWVIPLTKEVEVCYLLTREE